MFFKTFLTQERSLTAASCARLPQPTSATLKPTCVRTPEKSHTSATCVHFAAATAATCRTTAGGATRSCLPGLPALLSPPRECWVPCKRGASRWALAVVCLPAWGCQRQITWMNCLKWFTTTWAASTGILPRSMRTELLVLWATHWTSCPNWQENWQIFSLSARLLRPQIENR